MVWFYLSFRTLPSGSLLRNWTFNPTMVWFYRISVSLYGIFVKNLSIPLWSDFISAIYSLRDFCEEFLSIPLWSDFIRQFRCSSSTKSSFLSIPLWSDFILLFDFPYNSDIITFNPTMVWFYRAQRRAEEARRRALSIPLWSDFIEKLDKLIAIAEDAFQSHYGLILSKSREDS